MKNTSRLLTFLVCAAIWQTNAVAAERTLDIYWADVEGGAATLIVTPEKESVLIDSGSAGGRDPQRIFAIAKAAGLARIDYFILTHFHNDHFGGVPELSQLIPISTVLDNGIPERDPDHNPDDTRFPLLIKPYRDMKVGRRAVIQPDEFIPLRQSSNTAGAKLSFHCLEARQIIAPSLAADGGANANCTNAISKPKDTSDNANSVVMLLQFGKFRFFAGGDLTWNVEAGLVCPGNRVGTVDVYQVGHHGLDQSNNPLLVRALSPTVTVMSNGTTKGCEPGTFATLSSVPGLQAQYQIHRNLRKDAEHNAPDEYIANLTQQCSGNCIKLSVASDGNSYEVGIPATGQHHRYQTKTHVE